MKSKPEDNLELGNETTFAPLPQTPSPREFVRIFGERGLSDKELYCGLSFAYGRLAGVSETSALVVVALSSESPLAFSSDS